MQLIESASCNEAQTRAAEFIAKELSQHAQAKRHVAWLLSGGSAVAVAVEAARHLPRETKQRIIIAQVDERFVEPGSSDENWQQLQVGGFNLAEFEDTLPILGSSDSLQATARNYAQALAKILKASAFSIGLFGIGSDGHTAGIKPAPSADSFKQFTGSQLAIGYAAKDFQRITIGAAAIKQLDLAVVYACGTDKSQVVKSLDKTTDPYIQPAQLLKLAPNLVIFN